MVCWFGSFITSVGLSLIIPFLPLFIEHLGVGDVASVARWSGAAFGSTFFLAAIFSPIWGRLADTHGRKLMLMRASLGMAIIMALMGFSQNIYQLVGLRIIMGAVSGYCSTSIALIAIQTPKEHSGWALGTLSTSQVGGMLLGPLLGGILAECIGMRPVFWVTGLLLFCSFLITVFFVQDAPIHTDQSVLSGREVWASIPDIRQVLSLFLSVFMLQVGNLSVEPIVTIYIKQLAAHSNHVAMISGTVFAASGLAAIIMAPVLGKISDRVGPRRVLITSLLASALLLIPQAYVHNPWQLMGFRFLMGIAVSGLLPSVNSLLRRMVPDLVSGRIYGYSQSAQHLGSIIGPIMGGQMAAVYGIRAVFFCTSSLLLLNAMWVFLQGGVKPLSPRSVISAESNLS